MTATLFIGSRLVAQWPVSIPEIRTYASVAYFCPVCGDIWARIVVGERYFHPVYAHCSKHDRGLPVEAGSIFHPLIDRELIADFPYEVWFEEAKRLALLN